MSDVRKLLVFVRLRDDSDRASAVEEWCKAAAYAMSSAGLRNLVSTFVLNERLQETAPARGIHNTTTVWDGVSEFVFPSAASADSAIANARLHVLQGGAPNVSAAEALWVEPITILGAPLSGNIARFVLLKRRVGLTKGEFSRYWRNEHAKLVTDQDSIRARMRYYVQNHVLAGVNGATPSYDGVVETEYATVDDTYQVLSDPEIAKIIREDEARFIARDELVMFRARRRAMA
jgi:hypothetical protein